MQGRRSQLEEGERMAPRDATLGEKVRVWWEPTDDKKRSDYSGAFWPAEVRGKYKNKYRVRYDNGDEEEVDAEHVSPLDTLPVDFGQEDAALAVGEFCEVSNDSKTDPCAWLGRIRRGQEGGSYLVEYPLHDSKPEKIKAARIRRARVMEDGEWRLIKPGQTWPDGEVTSPTELELIYEDTLEEELELLQQAMLTGKRDGAPQLSGSSKRARGTAGPRAIGAGMVMDGMLSMFVTVDPVPGPQKFCFMPVASDQPVTSDAIQVYFRQTDVPQLREVSAASESDPPRGMGKRAVGRPSKAASLPHIPKPKTAEELYTDQFLKALQSTNEAPSPLTKAQAIKAAANAWESVAPNVKQKYEEMAEAVALKYQEQLLASRN